MAERAATGWRGPVLEHSRSPREQSPSRNPFDRVVAVHKRPGFIVEPASIGWDAVAFALHGQREGIACVPRNGLAGFLDDLDAGELDEPIARFLAAPPAKRVLRFADQTTEPGLFDELASPGAIAPRERKLSRLGRLGPGGGTPTNDRRDKRSQRPRPRRLLIASVLAVAVVAGAIVAATRSNHATQAREVVAPLLTTTPPLVDPCLVGRWHSVSATGFFIIDTTNERVALTGGTNTTLVIGADGNAVNDLNSTTYVGTLADGRAFSETQTGTIRYRLVAAGGVEHISGFDASAAAFTAQVGGVPQINTRFFPPPDTGSYTCTGSTFTEAPGDGSQTTWASG